MTDRNGRRAEGSERRGDREVEEKTDERRDDAHLDSLEVGADCTEIWDHLADRRGK